MQKYGRRMIDAFSGHLREIISTTVFIVVGIVLGNMLVFALEMDEFSDIYGTVSGFFEDPENIKIDKISLFFQALKGYTLSFILILVCSFSFWMIPIIFIKLIGDGVLMGLASGILVRLFGLKGFLTTGILLVFKNFFYIPFLIFFTIYSIKFSLSKRRKEIKKTGTVIIKKLLIVLIISIICSSMDGFIFPCIMLKII